MDVPSNFQTLYHIAPIDSKGCNPDIGLAEAINLPNFLYHDPDEWLNSLICPANSQQLQDLTPTNSDFLSPLDFPQATNYQYQTQTNAHDEDSLNAAGTLRHETTSASSSFSTLSTIRELNNLNIKLYAHASSIPKPPNLTTETLSWKDKDFAMDQTFELSQSMIALLNRLSPARAIENSLNNSPKFNSLTPQSPHPLADPESPRIDQASMLIILSCHIRLMETYDHIFRNMQACLDRSSTTAPEDYVSLPCVSVGSFSFPPTSAMQLTMILHCASEILGRLRKVTVSNRLYTASQDEDFRAGSDLDPITITAKAVTRKQKKLIDRIKNLRQSLVILDII